MLSYTEEDLKQLIIHHEALCVEVKALQAALRWQEEQIRQLQKRELGSKATDQPTSENPSSDNGAMGQETLAYQRIDTPTSTENAIKTIQIFGERCSGTNYLEHLLKKNLKDVQIRWDFGWKHWFHQEGVENADHYLFIVIYRNPFDWLRSLHRKPAHAALELRSIDFSNFIRKTWWCIWDEHAKITPEYLLYGVEMMFERDPETYQRFSNVIQLRAAKIKNWESLRNKTKNHIYVRYEDLKVNPEAFILAISEEFGIKRTDIFEDVLGEKGRSELYVPKVYDPIIAEDLAYILQELDIKLEKSIGYDIETLAAEVT